MYRNNGIQKQAERILKDEGRRPGKNTIGLAGFVFTLLAALNFVVCVGLVFFCGVEIELIRDNLDIYFPLFAVMSGILGLGFLFSAIGAFVGYRIEKYRMVKARTILCVIGMALAVIIFMVMAILITRYVF